MYNQNCVLLTGKLGGDAEIVPLANGKVAKMSLAVDHNYKDGGGRWRTDVHWIRVVTYWPHLIDTVLDTEATKGRLVFVQGALRARQWDQDGRKHQIVEVEVDSTGGITPITKDMAPINRVLLAGRLGGHADIKTLPGKDGRKVASFSLAAERSYKGADGEWHNDPNWQRVFTFAPSLIDKVLAKQATKGRLVLVEGALRYRQWDQDGETRTTVEIEVDGSGSISPVLEDKAA